MNFLKNDVGDLAFDLIAKKDESYYLVEVKSSGYKKPVNPRPEQKEKILEASKFGFKTKVVKVRISGNITESPN